MREFLRRVRHLLAGAAVRDRALPDGDSENPDNWFGLDYIHDRISSQLAAQSGLWEEINGRLRLILGVTGIVFAATLGLLPRGSVSVSTPQGTVTQPLFVPFAVGVCAVASMTLYFVAGLIATVAYWPRDFNWPPAPASLRKYLTSDEREIKLTVVDEMLDAYADNEVELERKVRAFRRALAITVLATGLLGAAVIIELVTVTRPLG